MHKLVYIFLGTLFFLIPGWLSAGCLPISEAPKHIGDNVCITGKVLKISSSQRSGTHFLNFCEDIRKCPFSVVIFSRDMDRLGDLTLLEGKTIEIHGKIKEYNGQAETVLDDAKQLNSNTASLPRPPQHYDVETEGHANPGQFKDAASKDAKAHRHKKPRGNGTEGTAEGEPPQNP